MQIPVDRIVLRGPLLDFTSGHVRLIVVLSVSFAPIRDQLNERDPVARPGMIDGRSGHIIRGQHIVAVGLQSQHTVADGFVDEALGSRLLVRRSRVRVPVVLNDDHQWTLLHGREVDAFVKRASTGGAVSNVDESDAVFPAHPERHRHTGHDRHHVAKRRYLPKKPTRDAGLPDVPEVNVEFAATGGRVGLGHVLLQHLHGRRAFHEHRAEIADERRHDVALFEREATANRVGLLTERTKEPTHHPGLPIQVHETLFEQPRQFHPVVQLELALARERVAGTRSNGRCVTVSARLGHQ